MLTTRELLFSFEGRINRKRFVVGNIIAIINFAITAALAYGIFHILSKSGLVEDTLTAEKLGSTPVVNIVLGLQEGITTQKLMTLILLLLPASIFVWSLLAVYAKRLHDLAIPGFLALLPVISFFIPYTQFYSHYLLGLLFLILAFIPGKEGDNRYGFSDD